MGLITLSDGQVAYNGYLFNSTWMLSEIDYELDTEPASIPFAPGDWIDSAKPGPKMFTMQGAVGGNGSVKDANGNVISTLDQAQAEIDRIMPLLFQGEQPLQWRKDRYVNAQASKPKITYMTGNGYRIPMIVIPFVANDPRSFSKTSYSVACQCGSSGGSVSFNLTNNGSYRAYPTITISFQSTCVNPVIEVDPPTGGGSYILNLIGTFTTGDHVTVICDPRTRVITKNAARTWSILSLPITNTTYLSNEFLPFLDGTAEPTTPAVSVVKVSATSGQFTATFGFRDVWI